MSLRTFDYGIRAGNRFCFWMEIIPESPFDIVHHILRRKSLHIGSRFEVDVDARFEGILGLRA
jgi:hypothetical protein